MQKAALAAASGALRSARSVVVLTGAGVSAESGVPTFRDRMEGLWSRYDPMQLATPEAFARDPELVSRWYDERRARCGACRPNAGHEAIARMEKLLRVRGDRFTLLTQNVDRLHQAAGSEGAIELHGSLWLWRCVACGEEREERETPFAEHPPRCACGGMRRPGVVWFGESLPEAAMQAAARAFETCDLFLSIGTSAVVYPAAGFVHAAKSRGARTIEINPEPTPITGAVDWSISGKSGEVVPELVRQGLEE